MKKIIRFLAILVIVTGIYQGHSCLAQNEATLQELKKPSVLFSKPIEDESVPVSVGIFYGSEGWGGSVTFKFMESWRYQHFGISASQEVPLDIFYGFIPVKITNSLMIKTDIGFGLKTEVDMRDLQKTLSTFGQNDGLVVYISPGFVFEAGRFEMNFDYQIGQLFSEGTTARWRQMFRMGAAIDF